jgi:hypothetical protein
MSTASAVTMQDLELESAELLPSRETLWCSSSQPSYSFTQVGLVNTGPILSGNAVAVSVFGSSSAIGGGNNGIGNL